MPRQDKAAPKAQVGPIDLDFLASRTFGDPGLQAEILTMFHDQLADAVATIRGLGASQRWALAHGIKGAARSIGALDLAECASSIEDEPEDEARVDRLVLLAEEAQGFIRSMRA